MAAAALSGNSLRQTVHTHRASVHQAAKLIAALTLKGCEGNCGPTTRFVTHVTCKLTAKNWDQLQNPMLSNQVWVPLLFYSSK